MKRLIVFVLVICFQVNSKAQLFDRNREAPVAHQNFKSLQNDFREWSQQQNLDKTKGWKWYKRWEHYNETRADENGELPKASTYFNEVLRLNRNAAAEDEANWSPIGPMAIPDSPNPFSGHGIGRINSITFHPTNPNIFWVAVAQGGIWKTENSGESWLPLSDNMPLLRTTHLAVDPNNTDILYVSIGDFEYVGTALDLDDRDRNTHFGLGVYKSTNGGVDWTPTGLTFQQTDADQTLIRSVIVNPENSNELVAAGISGIHISNDGGENWNKVYDELMIDLIQDPNQTQVLYAASAYIGNLDAGNAGILKSTDFGANWTVLASGIPEQNAVQRTKLAISPQNSDYIYALCSNMSNGFYALYRSTDGGENWTEQSDANDGTNILAWNEGIGENGGQGLYDLALLVDPNNPETIYTGGVNLWGSTDGGETWNGASYWRGNFGPSIHADQHYFAYNALDEKFYVCNDGGVVRSSQIEIGSWDEAFTVPDYNWPTEWENISDGMNITAFYRIGLSANNEDYMIAGSQDNSTFYNNTSNWSNLIGGDGMECTLHPNDQDFILGSWQYGGLALSTSGGAFFEYDIANEVRADENGEWTTPFMLNPADPSEIYAGYGNLWKSDNEGFDWEKVSDFPDIIGEDYPVPISHFSIAASDPTTIYVAKRVFHSFDLNGELWRTTDEGNNWTNITEGLPDGLYFNYITISDTDPQKIWLAVGGFTENKHVYSSIDGGDTWLNISSNLPNLPVNCILHQAGSEKNIVYAGTDLGVYYTNDDMDGWEAFNENLPNVIVSEMEIHYDSQKIYATTFGRGIWVSDMLPSEVDDISIHEAYQNLELTIQPNPNNGHFYISSEQLPEQNFKLEIVDIAGRTVYSEMISQNGKFQKNISAPLKYGTYFLKISGEKFSHSKPFLVKP